MKTSSKKPIADQKKRRVLSDFEVDTYYRYYTQGFDHLTIEGVVPDKTPKWWRRVFS